MSELIYRNDGEPFANEQGANLRAGHLRAEGKVIDVVSVDGGFALQEKVMPRPADVAARSNRGERIPVGVRRQKLKAPGRPGFKQRWVNDEERVLDRVAESGDCPPGRLASFVQGGYDFVRNDDAKAAGVDGPSEDTTLGLGTIMARHAGTTKDGAPMMTVLMEIPEDLYEKDQRAKQEQVDETDRAIRAGKFGDRSGGQRVQIPGGISFVDK